MANRKPNPNGKTCKCVVCDCDHEITKEGLAMTPSQVRALTNAGVAVSLPAGEYLTSSSDGWRIEPMFERGTSLAKIWSTEKIAQSRVIAARKRDVDKYGK